MERLEETKKRFKFPFIPYEIQSDFMQTLYDVLEDGSVGIFESPTGKVFQNWKRWKIAARLFNTCSRKSTSRSR